MKKKIAALILIFAMMVTLAAVAFAEEFDGQSGWKVEFGADKLLHSNFKTSDIADTISNMQPGDTVTMNITLKNPTGYILEWYMLNEIINSLEDTQAKAAGGGYTYLLTYKPSEGAMKTLYDSKKVGGEQATENKTIEGLNEVESNLKNYMYLETMYANKSGLMTLTVSLDGESQGNSYQDSVADLRLRFATEIIPGYKIIKTGDETMKLVPFYIGMAATGLLFVLFAFIGLRQKKRNGGESK